MQQLLTMDQVKEKFQFKDNRTIKKFINQGLRFVKLGSEYRFDVVDIENFIEEQKNNTQEIIEIKPVKSKQRCRTLKIDFEKRQINLKQLKVI